MGTLVIRNLDDGVKERLRNRARARGRSMEEEARQILGDAVSKPLTGRQILDLFREAFGPENGVDLELDREWALGAARLRAMIILDTNVLSELMKATPDRQVQGWMATRQFNELATTAVCQAEIFSGIALMPDGRRKRSLASDAQRVFSLAFSEAFAFDSDAALLFGEIVASRQKKGLGVDLADVMIAAIARARSAAVATRNVTDFQGCGIDILDPWADP